MLHRERSESGSRLRGVDRTAALPDFTTEIGTPLEPRKVLRRFEQIVREAGLPRVSLHTLRHTAASLLLAAGTHTKVVPEHLGHSSFAITADIYSHVGPAQQREAAGRLDQALRW